MRCLPAVLDSGTPPHLLAVLILDPTAESSARTPSGEHLDQAPSRLLALGFTLLRDADQ
jgi:hypothetical protein